MKPLYAFMNTNQPHSSHFLLFVLAVVWSMALGHRAPPLLLLLLQLLLLLGGGAASGLLGLFGSSRTDSVGRPVFKVPVLPPCYSGSFYSPSHSADRYEEAEWRCVACPSGKYGWYDTHQSLPMNALKCASCPEDTMSLAGARGCVDCPAGQLRASSAPACAFHCKPGTWVDRGSASCVACAPGRFSRRTNAEMCDRCADGFKQPRAGESACLACDVGEYSRAAGEPRTTCDKLSPCPAGRFRDAVQQCRDCARQTFAPQPGAAYRCHPCPRGHKVSADRTSCETPRPSQCPKGKFFNLRRAADGKGLAPADPAQPTPCAPCAAGKYGDVLIADLGGRCLDCPAGQFQHFFGRLSCERCLPGSYLPAMPALGSFAQRRCQECAPGHFAAEAGAASCTKCSRGRFALDKPRTSCNVDLDGTPLPPLLGCKPGYARTSKHDECTPCAPGTRQPPRMGAKCVAC